MEWAQHLIEQYGYWAVFIWTFIEGETVFVAAAALTAVGILEPWKVIIVAASGAFSGHAFFFTLGRWKGLSIIESMPFLQRHYSKVNVILDKYAHWSIFIFQYLYGTRIVAALLFGCSSISSWRFYLLQVVNCISWSFVVYAVGHTLGMAGLAILNRFGVFGLITALIVAVCVGLMIYLRYGHHHVKNHLKNTNTRQND